jgi:hypothetical protein
LLPPVAREVPGDVDPRELGIKQFSEGIDVTVAHRVQPVEGDLKVRLRLFVTHCVVLPSRVADTLV